MRTIRADFYTPSTNEIMGAGTYGFSFDQAQTLMHYGAWYYRDPTNGPANVEFAIWNSSDTVVATTGSVDATGHNVSAWNFVPFISIVTLPYGTYRIAMTTTATCTIHRNDGIFGTFTEEGGNLVGTQGVETSSAYPAAPSTTSSRLYAVDMAFSVPADPDRWLHAIEHGWTTDPVNEDTNGGERTNIGLLFTVSDRGALLGFRYFCPTFGAGIVTFRLYKRDGTSNGSGGFLSTRHSCYVVPGWNDLTFDGSVIMLEPDVAYVAQVLTVQGYAYTAHALTSPLNRGHLHFPADGEAVVSEGNTGVSSTNGRFSSTTGFEAFPDSSFNETNYGVDVLFVPGVRTLFQTTPSTLSANDGVTYTLGTSITPNVSGRIHGSHMYVADDGSALVQVDMGIWDATTYNPGDHASPYRTFIPPYNMVQNRRVGQLFPNHGFLYRDTDTSSEIMSGLLTRAYVAQSHFFDAPVSNDDASLTGATGAGQFADSVTELTYPSSSFNNGAYWADMLYELIPETTGDVGAASRFFAFF